MSGICKPVFCLAFLSMSFRWYNKLNMYKQPPKHIQRAKLVVLYSIMTVAVLVVVALLVMVVGNYSYNRATGVIEQRGLVQFGSVPSAVNVEIDGTLLSAKTSTKSSVEPGERNFTFWKDNYKPWSLTTPVKSGSLVWLDYIRLVPERRDVETLHQYDSVTDARFSPTNRSILMQLDAKKPEFRLVDISHDTPTGTTLALPESTYKLVGSESAAAKRSTPKYTLDSWDESGRYVFVWRTLGLDKQLIVLNTEDPSKSVNVSREFSLPIEAAEFAGRSGNVLYVKSDGNVRKLNISDGTATRTLLSGVDTFALQDNDTISYTSLPQTDSGSRTLGSYRDGDDTPTVLKTIMGEHKPVSIVSRSYYNTLYTAIAEGSKIEIYRGNHDNGLDDMKLIASRTLDEDIESVEFNSIGSLLLVRSKQSFASYDIDRNLLLTSKLDTGMSKDMFWLDSYHLGLTYGGMLTMRDFNGTNTYELNATQSALSAGLSRNGTYMYSFGKTDKGTTSLQRIRMILK